MREIIEPTYKCFDCDWEGPGEDLECVVVVCFEEIKDVCPECGGDVE